MYIDYVFIKRPDVSVNLASGRLAFYLYYRQTDSVYLLVDVKSIYIGHTADIIDYRHDTLFYILDVNVV